MTKIPNSDEGKKYLYPLLLVIGVLAATILSCSQLLGSPTETPLPNPTNTATILPSPLPTSTATVTPSETPSPTSTPSRSIYSNQSLGLSLTYPSDWTIDDSAEFVAFTRPDGWAQISVGWHTLQEGQSTAIVAELLAGIRVEKVSEPLVVYIDHEGRNPVEVSVRGDDSAGVEWVYHFVVADSGDRALIIETVATAEDQEALEPIFEEIILSMERTSQ